MLRLLPDRRLAASALALLIAVQGIWGVTRITRLCEGKAANDLQYLVLLESMKNHIPDGAAVIASGGC